MSQPNSKEPSKTSVVEPSGPEPNPEAEQEQETEPPTNDESNKEVSQDATGSDTQVNNAEEADAEVAYAEGPDDVVEVDTSKSKQDVISSDSKEVEPKHSVTSKVHGSKLSQLISSKEHISKELDLSLSTSKELDIKPSSIQIEEKLVEDPAVKRERARRCRCYTVKTQPTSIFTALKKDQPKLRAEVRAKVPMMTVEEVRRHRIPYFEAMLLELQEDGFNESAEFYKNLLQHNRNMREKAGPSSTLWLKPMLEQKPKLIDILVLGLREAESGRQNGDAVREANELLKISIAFSKKKDYYWWLADQLFLTAVDVAHAYKADGGRKEAVARFIYALFLTDQLGEIEEATIQLHCVRELSIGKKWMAHPELYGATDNLFRKSCGLLYNCMLILSRRFREHDPKKAATFCAIAIKRAIEADKDEGIAATLMEQGLCNLSVGDLEEALVNFKQALARSMSGGIFEAVCEAHLQISHTYVKMRLIDLAKKHLKYMLMVASNNTLEYQVGRAHRALGEFYLKHTQEYRKAAEQLIQAVEIFFNLKKAEDLMETRCLQGIASGQEIMQPFFSCVIKSCDADDDLVNLFKLIKWKESRQPFWILPDDFQREEEGLEENYLEGDDEIGMEIGDEGELEDDLQYKSSGQYILEPGKPTVTSVTSVDMSGIRKTSVQFAADEPVIDDTEQVLEPPDPSPE